MVQQVWKMCPNYKHCTCWQGHGTSVDDFNRASWYSMAKYNWRFLGIWVSGCRRYSAFTPRHIAYILLFLHLAATLLTTGDWLYFNV